MSQTRHVTLQQVAQHAEVSVSTASRCLRGDPRFSEETRRRVGASARALGYRPDPMMSALAAYRTEKAKKTVRATLAYIHPYANGLAEAPVPRHRLWSIFHGARLRAEAHGYRLTEFALPDEAAVPAVQRILEARGIEGAILCAVRESPFCSGLDFGRMAAVSIGYTLEHLGFHIIAPHYFRGAMQSLEELLRRSSTRIGLALFDNSDARADHLIRAAFAYMREIHPDREWLPPLVVPGRLEQLHPTFLDWFQNHKPDAILTNEWLIIEDILRCGCAVPRDVNVVLTDTAHPTALGAGIFENPEVIGARAIDQLISLIQHREFGSLQTTQHTFVEGCWVEGTTVRPLVDATPEELAQRALIQRHNETLPSPPKESFGAVPLDIGYGPGVPAPK